MPVRPAVDDDFDAIAALTNHYITTTSIHFGYHPIPAAEVREGWRASRDKYPLLVATTDDRRFAGFAKAYRWREREAYAFTAEIGVYVAPEFHRRGFARSLYTALIAECRSRGFHTLVAGIALPNEASIRLHEALGFKYNGVFREVGWKFDAWHDVAFYQMMLADAPT